MTNVIDPFNGSTKFEYDRVGRKTKRTLPNNIVTEWQYDWRDRVTNITHKISGTTLASVLYERLAGGEPSKITREDGTYVELKYDAALRLTNEVYYNASSVAQATNSYAYDASGNRIRFAQPGLTLTNSVSGGYQIMAVKNAANGSTAQSYGYDNGGRVTTITRDSATLDLGYNSVDQVTAVTNGANWVTYTHDAAGRRMFSTNNSTVRKFLVAATPGTDLESPHLIANASGTVQQGYVYLGDDPILRYDTSGAAAYYLEDGMGSVIGLAPVSSPSLANTTRIFYGGFGNTRSTAGPSPTIPTGTGGDFRFHGAWLEEQSGLYHMRAREYDARMGRFTSRDPESGSFKVPDTLPPYTFACNNPLIYSDPSGRFTMIEMSLSGTISQGMQAFRAAAINKGRQKVLELIGNMARDQFAKSVKNLLPVPDLLASFKDGVKLGEVLRRMICSSLHVPDQMFFEVPITTDGRPLANGFACNEKVDPAEILRMAGLGVPRPDFIIGSRPPHAAGSFPKTYLISEIKATTATLYNDYIAPGKKSDQFWAAINYAGKHTYSRTVLFVTGVKGKNPPNDIVVITEIGKSAISKGVVPIVIRIVD